MFLTGPGVVKEALGEEVTAAELGGHRVHERNGVCHFVAPTDADAASSRDSCSATCRATAMRALPVAPAFGPGATDPAAAIPAESRGVYDVRDVIAALVDAGEMLEVSAGWARNLVTAFARIEGRPVGVIANQPRYLGGVLDASSSEKGARFVSQCNAFGVPLLVLVDTPGFMPGTRQEVGGRDQARSDAGTGVRRGDRAAGDGRAAQGLRRGLHHDELEGSRRRLRVRVAAGGGRGDGRAAGGRDHPPARVGRGG